MTRQYRGLMAKYFTIVVLIAVYCMFFSQVGHIIDPPYNPFNAGRWLKGLKVAHIYGGSMLGHALAQEAAWKETRLFFRKHLTIDCKI